MMSSGRWLAVGSAILSVGALLAVSWLIYAIQSKTDFWAWPGITGVAIAAVGLVALVAGFVMPKDEEPATAQQTLHAEAHSMNLQAGRDIVYNGLTAAEYRQVALDVYEANFLRLVGIAEDVARDRAERITHEFVDALWESNPDGLGSMTDPDMLRTLYTAQEGYACSGEDDLEKSLVALLVGRAGQVERDTKTHALNQAIATLPKLARNHRAALAVNFFLRYSHYIDAFELSAFYEHLKNSLVPFVSDIPEKFTDYSYMESMGVGKQHVAAVSAESSMYDNAYGFFMRGFTRKQAASAWRQYLDDPNIFMTCLRDHQKLQIKARSLAELHKIAASKDATALITNSATGRMSEAEIKEDLTDKIPAPKSSLRKIE